MYAIAFGALTGQFLYLILDGNVLSSTGIIGSLLRGTELKLYICHTDMKNDLAISLL